MMCFFGEKMENVQKNVVVFFCKEKSCEFLCEKCVKIDKRL